MFRVWLFLGGGEVLWRGDATGDGGGRGGKKRCTARGTGQQLEREQQEGVAGVLWERKVVDLTRAKCRLVEVPYTANTLLTAHVSAVATGSAPAGPRSTILEHNTLIASKLVPTFINDGKRSE